MTTTGGPERSLADPATSEQAEYPIVVDRDDVRLDGDDIVIEPDAPNAARPRRTRALVVGAIVAVLLIGGIALALVSRDDGSASKLSSSAPTPSTQPTPKPNNVVPPKPAPTAPPQPANQNPPEPVVTVPQAVEPSAPVESPPVESPPVVIPPTPPPAEPPSSPMSVVVWRADPGSLTIKAGGHKAFVLTLFNPSDGTVTLPHPLSCPPVLTGPNGATFGFGVCAEMAQLMAPNTNLKQGYTIYATDTADASGQPLKPGKYTVTIENNFKLPVTVTER